MIAIAAAPIVLAAVSGCARTTRIDDEEFSVRRLARENRGVGLMRVGAASWKCVHVAVLLAQRFGDGYRRVKVLGVANVRSVAAAPVAEVELDAGEYHVVAYSCSNDKGSRIVADDTGSGSQLYKRSYARFSIGPGEVVNLGYIHFHAENKGDSVYGRGVKTDVAVTDWPLDEIGRFERQRPHLFAAMTTRLIEVGDPMLTTAELADTCDQWRNLIAGGKAARLPEVCARKLQPAERGMGKTGAGVTDAPQNALR